MEPLKIQLETEQLKIIKMGTYLSQPKTQKKIELQRFQHSFVTTCQMQGWRNLMEDAIIFQQLCKGIQLYCIFDGHGGPQVSTWVSRNLPQQLVKDPNFKQKNYSKALTNTFKKIDQMLRSAKGEAELKKIYSQLNLSSQYYDIQYIGYRAGCTANVVLVTKQKIIVANIGDSRSVLCKKGVAIPLSFDHKPDNPEESSRINGAGAYIKNGRINGQVNLSRAFGDFEYKSILSKKDDEQPVISVPDIRQFTRTIEDEFIIMGCDGIWQRYKDNQKMIDYVKEMRNKYKDKKKFIEKFVDSLLGKNVKQQYGLDNMSVILIDIV